MFASLRKLSRLMIKVGRVYVSTLVLLCHFGPACAANEQPPRPVEEPAQVWAGELATGNGAKLRLVLNIKTSESGAMSATLDSPDQGAQALEVNSITLADGRLAFELRRIGASFTGALDATGAEALGQWNQGGRNIPLALRKRGSAASVASSAKPFLVLDAGGHTSRVRQVLFTPDGTELISVSDDKTVRIWNVESGMPVRVIRTPIGHGFEGMLSAAAISPDGRFLAVGGSGFWSLKRFPIYVVTLAGSMVQVLEGHAGQVLGLSFSPDGKQLASASADRTARVWEMAGGHCKRVLEGHEAMITGIAFSPDGARLATASYDKTGRIWSLADGRCESVLRGHEREVKCVAWQPDGAVIVTGALDGTIRKWTSDGAALQSVVNATKNAESLTFTPDSRELLVTGFPGACMVDLSTDQTRVRFEGHANFVVFAGAVSPDGTRVATAAARGEIYLWQRSDGKTLHKLASRGTAIHAVAWGSDEQTLIFGTTQNHVSDNNGGPLEHSFRVSDLELSDYVDPDHSRAYSMVGSMALERIGSTVLAIKQNDEVISRITINNPKEGILSYTFLGSERVALGTSVALGICDARTGKLIRRLVGHTSAITAVAPSRNGQLLLSGSGDQTVRLWNINRDEPILSLFFAGQDWIAWTPEGYYAGSPSGEMLMGWQVDRGPGAMGAYYPASQFRKSLYRPDVIKRLLVSTTLDKALASADTAAGRQSRRTEVAQILPPKVAITAPRGARVEIGGGTLDVEAVANSVGSHPVTGLRVLLDGRPLPDAVTLFPSATTGQVRGSWRIDVPSGNHRLAVQARTDSSTNVSDSIDLVAGASSGTTKGSNTLHILAIGINEYPDARLKLACAAPDARLLRQAFLDKSRRLFPGGVEAKLLLDGQATRDNILAELRQLAATVKAGDVAIVFYAGHGDSKIEGQFYLVPVDANLRNLSATGISGEALKKAIGELPCSTMLILDACESGGFDQKKKRKTRGLPAPSDTLVRDLVYDSGLVVMCGAAKEQEAAEENGQGFFTRAIVEALGGTGDLDKDGLVELDELDMYVRRRVRALSSGDQEPTISIPSIVRSFALSKP